MPLKKTVLLFVFIPLAPFVLYLPTLSHPFLNWDDAMYVLDDPAIRSLDLTLLRRAFSEVYFSNWQPLTRISYAVDFAIWGPDPFGYHLTNAVCHALNAFLVTLLALRVLRLSDALQEKAALWGAAISGLLFGLHPLQVESVAWVSDRKDLLCGLFSFMSLIAYLSYAGDRRTASPGAGRMTGKYLLCLSLFVAALLSKPAALTLPIIFLVIDWYPLGSVTMRTFGRRLLEKSPFFLVSLASAATSVMAQRGASDWVAAPISDRVLLAVRSYVFYLGKFLIPTGLSPFYPYPLEVDLFSAEYFMPLLVFLAITLFCSLLAFRKRRPACLAFWAAYVLSFLPASGIFSVGAQAMADRYTYIPGAAAFILAGAGSAALAGRLRTARERTAAVALFLVPAFLALSYGTREQLTVWEDDLSLWTRVVAVAETSGTRYRSLGIAYNNLGEAYKNRGLLEAAVGPYQKAIREFQTASGSDAAHGSFYRLGIMTASANLAVIREALSHLPEGRSDNAPGRAD